MFGSRSGSPYGAFGLINAPVASDGQGGPLSGGHGAPMPSGGAPYPGQFSVYNKGLENEANTVPSCFVLPSSHPELCSDQNRIRETDFLFVIRDTSGCGDGGDRYADNYETRYSRLGKNEVAVVTIQKLNQLLRSCASKRALDDQAIERAWNDIETGAVTVPWWTSPEAVAAWAVPFGAALNSMRIHGGVGDPNASAGYEGHNVVVSRRASIKNNFFTVRGESAEKWHTQSMRHVAVQYSVEAVLLHDNSQVVPCVQICMLLVDDYDRVRGISKFGGGVGPVPVGTPPSPEWSAACAVGTSGWCRAACDPKAGGNIAKCIVINAVHPDRPKPDEPSYSLFAERPLGDPSSRVIICIGRVLHSAPRCPTASECLMSCHDKAIYDKLRPVEIELGSG